VNKGLNGIQESRKAAVRTVIIAWCVLIVDALAVYLSRPDLVANTQMISLGVVSAVALGILPTLRESLERPRAVLMAGATLIFFMQSGVVAIGGDDLLPLLGLYVVPVLAYSAASSSFAALVALVVATACVAFYARLVPLEASASTPRVAAIAVLAVLWVAHFYASVLSGRLRLARESDDRADRDPLTSLYHLTAFRKLAAAEHARAAADESRYALLMIDLDKLKTVNDRYGYETGDRAIALVATILARLKRQEDILARYAGDKFVLLLPGTITSDALAIAQRIRNNVFKSSIQGGKALVRVKANIGVASYPIDGASLDAMLSAAESDMLVDRKGRETPGKMPVFERLSGTRKK
jgi:diguanylate cyclase (GGDEF)-like protein